MQREMISMSGDPNQTQGSYIIALREEGDNTIILELYSEFGISSISRISKNTYLVIFKNDPGADRLRKRLDPRKIEYIQPNFKYKAFRP